MQLELVNPFVEASYDIIKNFLPEGVSKSNIDLLNKDTILHGVSIRIRFKDKMRSAVVINMEEEVAFQIASQLSGEKIDNWDEYSQSIIQEFGNMLSGSAVTKLSAAEIDLDIAPPEFLSDANIAEQIKTENEAMNVTIDTIAGRLQVIVYIEE